jgi:hypothetical protein
MIFNNQLEINRQKFLRDETTKIKNFIKNYFFSFILNFIFKVVNTQNTKNKRFLCLI